MTQYSCSAVVGLVLLLSGSALCLRAEAPPADDTSSDALGTKKGDEVRAAVPAEEVTLTGKVVDTDGKPIPRAQVLILRKTWPKSRFQMESFATTTEDDGKYEFGKAYVLGQRYQFMVTVNHAGYALTSVYYENDAGKKLDDGRLTLSPAAPLTIRITNADGKPIDGIEFYPSKRVTPDGSQHLVYPITAQRAKAMWKKTDADGRAALTAIRPKDKAAIQPMIDGSLRELRFDVGDKREIDVLVPSAGLTEPRQAPDSKLVDWVKDHSLPFKSIDPADAEFDDLAPLKAIIGDARIVLLGEQSHGDGAAFHAKTRLIRFLHQEMGFDVLAFESGLYDCRRAWRAYREGQTPLTAAQLGIFGIWTGSTEVQPLIEYLGSNARTERPLEQAGFDDQLTALASRRHLLDDVKALAAKLDDKAIDAATLTLFGESIETIGRNEPLAERFDPFLAACDKIEQACTAVGKKGGETAFEFRFWSQFFKSVRTLARQIESKQNVVASSNLRDRQMAENLAWLASDLYPKRKIIVWAASYHLVANPRAIFRPDGNAAYAHTQTMGHELQSLIDRHECFTVGFTSSTGRVGTWFQPSRPLPQLPAGSLEDILEATGKEHFLLSFRHAGDDAKWLSEKRPASPLGYKPLVADWTQVFDAIVFIRKMYPSTRFETPTPKDRK